MTNLVRDVAERHRAFDAVEEILARRGFAIVGAESAAIISRAMPTLGPPRVGCGKKFQSRGLASLRRSRLHRGRTGARRGANDQFNLNTVLSSALTASSVARVAFAE
jgi:hypothetical protein